jgi:hypothetical protein
MIVIGGVYEEIVVEPESREISGSGMRAAAALSNRADKPVLHTVLDPKTREEAEFVADALGVTFTADAERSELIGFRYITPISAPSINGPNSRLLPDNGIEAAGTTALVFGLIEAPTHGVNVVANTIIFDPQRPRDAEPLQLDGLVAENFIVVANSSEIRKLGDNNDIRKAASNVLDKEPRMQGVVTKRGAAGCLVTRRVGTQISHTPLGAHPTTRVWPIGSGDVFSAGLAHAIDTGADLVEAARLGSAAAAHWCSTRSPAVSKAILAGDFSELPRPVDPTGPRIYLAGPFFSISERWLVETVRDELHSLGADVWSPVHEVGHGGLEVAQKDLDGLLECDVVLALLDHADPGTVFEVGWAVRHGIPVIGYARVLDPDGAKMMAGTKVELHTDLSSACYRAAWAGMGLLPTRGWVT